MYEDSFSLRLTQLRTSKGVSAREMSLAIGQNPGYINSIENQHSYPSLQGFFYICEYLNVTPSEFFDEGNSHPAEYRDILDDLRALDAEQLRNIRAIIKGLKR